MASSNYFSGPNYGAQVGVNHGTINYMYTYEMLIESHGLHNRGECKSARAQVLLISFY